MTERAVDLDDGARTALASWGDSGPVVLCVHGITGSRLSWSRFAERIEHRFRVYAYDQRGHGDGAAILGPMTLARSVRDLAEVAAALPAPVDVLVGHSWGGAVALLGGLDLHPPKVLAIDPMIRVAPGTFEVEYVDDVRGTLAIPASAREPALRAMFAGLQREDADAKVHAMREMSVTALENLARDNRVDDGIWDLREAIVGYPRPLLILAAGVDSVMSPDDLAWVRDRGGPNVTVRVFENEGHNLHRTAFDEFVTAFLTFAA